ncbi:HD domain-containing protein [Achromobacter sp. SD115]|uniref:HD domain-containing protein n=1 Tax=Achromobacter sp. SD115 TaxID=2782011 RepID=UPI001A971D5A|nr:HD domain-containing protein [Achromobacter sp. SD115]MBO1017100.1 HD domain-containing protein [Achromobacter sp. SD115]
MNLREDLAALRPQLIQIAQSADTGDGAHDLSHLERVWKAAHGMLAHHPEADAMVVMAASYLHDLVNLPKNHPDRARASSMAAGQAVRELQAIGYPPARLEGVHHAIEAHSYSANIPPRTIEARIVQDADRLDALGPVGLARMFHVGGQLGRALAHPADPLGTQRELDDGAYALDHIEVKLARIAASMQTEGGRLLARSRMDWIRRFRDDFVADWSA